MKTTSVRTIKELLKRHELKPLKRMGQNFLVSSNVVDKVVATADLKPSDTVLEIGPGLGALTIKIAEKAKQVIAVEKDRGLSGILRDVLKDNGVGNVEVVNEDILNFQFSSTNFQTISNDSINQFSNGKYKLIANLPYNIATAVIMQFLETKNPPQTMVVMLQKEVGKRICEKPPNMSKLTVFSQFYSVPKIVGYVSKRSFYPQPKVDSAILKITPTNTNSKQTDKKLFAKVVKAGFVHPRKQLSNNLIKGLNLSRQQTEQWISENNIQPSQRAETLSLDNWMQLTKTYPQNKLK